MAMAGVECTNLLVPPVPRRLFRLLGRFVLVPIQEGRVAAPPPVVRPRLDDLSNLLVPPVPRRLFRLLGRFVLVPIQEGRVAAPPPVVRPRVDDLRYFHSYYDPYELPP